MDRKTIQRDISYMRDEMRLPLEYHQVEHGYFYTKPVTDFPLLHLSRQDLLALFLARKALDPLRGTRLETVLAESFAKIAEACPGEVSFRWHDLDEAFSVRTTGVVPADLTLFSDLLDAVLECREVTFGYQKLNATVPERRKVRPYHVGQIENGWYLIGHDTTRGGERTFALQRISDLEVLRDKFQRPEKFDVREHFGGSFGVWSYAEAKSARHDVRIRFEGYAARIITERRWHPSQELVMEGGRSNTVELRLKLAGLEEVTRWVLSWGSKAEVLDPPALKERVRAEIERMATK